MTLEAEEFLRRFFLHVLPQGFVRIRYFGFLANRQRKHSLPLCRRLLADAMPEATSEVSSKAASGSAAAGASFWACPVCGTPMVILERLTPTQVYLRAPPALEVARCG